MEPLHELGRHRRSEICLLKRAVDTVDSVTRPIPQSNCYEGEDGKILISVWALYVCMELTNATNHVDEEH